jgi:flagellin
MASVINTNVASLNAQRNLTTSQSSLNTSLQRLSSGLRINSSKDDAAGLAIAERMSAQSRGMTVAIRNANDGISAAQTAEAGISVISGHLQRMRELAVQAASGQYDSDNRAALDTEYQALASEIERAAGATNFNGKNLLDGNFNVTFQVGATTSSESQIGIEIASIDTSSLGDLTGDDGANALAAIDALDAVIDLANTARADLGAVQNRFDGVMSQLSAARENTEAARSRIMDTDYAAETANLARSQILQQAGTAMLAQANALPQQVLSLLQ